MEVLTCRENLNNLKISRVLISSQSWSRLKFLTSKRMFIPQSELKMDESFPLIVNTVIFQPKHLRQQYTCSMYSRLSHFVNCKLFSTSPYLSALIKNNGLTLSVVQTLNFFLWKQSSIFILTVNKMYLLLLLYIIKFNKKDVFFFKLN